MSDRRGLWKAQVHMAMDYNDFKRDESPWAVTWYNMDGIGWETVPIERLDEYETIDPVSAFDAMNRFFES
jgi:hypothetical protein